MESTDDRTAWYNINLTEGLGPAAARRIARWMVDSSTRAGELVDIAAAEIQRCTGLSERISDALVTQLADPISLPEQPEEISLLLPSDWEFPLQRFLDSEPPMPPLLWSAGETSLISKEAQSIGIAGSRNAPEAVLDLTHTLARAASEGGWLVVSGLAAGVDSAAHMGALRGGAGTIGVLASGLYHLDSRWAAVDPDEPIAYVSEFEPTVPWSGRRAMQRNNTIASFSDRVVVVAAGESGGSWEMAQLCLKRRKTLFVLDLPESDAPGNQRLLLQGAMAVDPERIETCLEPAFGSESLTLFD